MDKHNPTVLEVQKAKLVLQNDIQALINFFHKKFEDKILVHGISISKIEFRTMEETIVNVKVEVNIAL